MVRFLNGKITALATRRTGNVVRVAPPIYAIPGPSSRQKSKKWHYRISPLPLLRPLQTTPLLHHIRLRTITTITMLNLKPPSTSQRILQVSSTTRSRILGGRHPVFHPQSTTLLPSINKSRSISALFLPSPAFRVFIPLAITTLI